MRLNKRIVCNEEGDGSWQWLMADDDSLKLGTFDLEWQMQTASCQNYPFFTQLAVMADGAGCVGHRSQLYRPMQQAA